MGIEIVPVDTLRFSIKATIEFQNIHVRLSNFINILLGFVHYFLKKSIFLFLFSSVHMFIVVISN